MKAKIWHKMIIGISIPSLIAVLGALLTYGYINDVKERQSLVQVADDMKENVLEIRRNEKNFLHFKDPEYLAGLRNAVDSFSDLTGEISLKTADKIGIDEITALKEATRKYSALAGKLGASFRKEAMITGKVRKEGSRLENIVESENLAKELSTSFILRLRLLETNYMLLRDESSRLELNRALSQITNVTPFCYECSPYIDAVKSLIAAYNRSDSLADDLQRTGDGMESAAEQITARERARIVSFISTTQKILLAGLVLLCILGPFFVYRTASYISAPIKRLDEIAKKIAAGDITLRAPLKEQDETYSLAVSFNTMLDNLVQAQQSLKESLELLNEKQAQLVESEKRASMGFLVAGIAHELNNPLNNISLRAEILNDEVKDLPNEQLRAYTEDIITQSRRAHKIINNLLDFARARKSSDMEKQDIIRIIEDSVALVSNQFTVRNIKVNKDLPEEPYFINGNRSKLEQVLVSIINNAFQAMTDTGTLTIRAEPDKESKSIHITISDNGRGIPEADLKNIFEPFFTTKSPGEGTGLGLAVSRTLIKEHNGEISVKSTVGEGTTFTITLPAYEVSIHEKQQ